MALEGLFDDYLMDFATADSSGGFLSDIFGENGEKVGPFAEGLYNAFGSPSAKKESDVARLVRNSVHAGNLLLGGMTDYSNNILADTVSQYGKAAAISDTQGAIRDIFDTYMKTALPQIYQAEAGSGGYNASTGQLLANDAYAQAVNKSAALMLDTIQKYRGIQQKDYDTFAGLGRAVPAVPTGGVSSGGGGGGGLGGILGGAIGSIASGIFSDSRLKENITLVGQAQPSGINLYTFTYRDDPTKTLYRGVMAQEVLITRPEAVLRDPATDYLKVNYTALGIPFEKV